MSGNSPNYDAFLRWLNKHRALIAPKKDLGVLYSGFMEPPGSVKQAHAKGLDVSKRISAWWEWIDRFNKMATKHKGKILFETLEIVTKSIKKHPEISSAKKTRYASLFAYANAAHQLDSGIMASPRECDQVWRNLSARYAQNCKGQVKILEGVKRNLAALDESSVMLNTEIHVLLKNKSVDADTLKAAEGLYPQAKKALSSFRACLKPSLSYAKNPKP